MSAAIRWKHPNRGEINETVCAAHESELLAALKFLAIGCVGNEAPEGLACDRCVHRFAPPRTWLGAA